MRKRQDSVFKCDYVSTPTRETQRSLRSLIYHYINLMNNIGYRLYIQLSLLNRGWVLGMMVFILHRDAKFSKFKTDISRNRNHQGYSPEGYQLSIAYIGWRQLILNRKFVEGKCLNCLLYKHRHFLYILYHKFFKKSSNIKFN